MVFYIQLIKMKTSPSSVESKLYQNISKSINNSATLTTRDYREAEYKNLKKEPIEEQEGQLDSLFEDRPAFNTTLEAVVFALPDFVKKDEQVGQGNLKQMDYDPERDERTFGLFMKLFLCMFCCSC